jgi:alkylation response protein AidB-like acyl-CoA dehydrogenase
MLARSPDKVAEYLAAIERLAPLIAEHRAAFDEQRRLPDVVFNVLADAGLFRLWLPVALGGPELSPKEFMTVVEAASALDGSVGWLVGNGGGMSRIGGYLREEVARTWFADPRAFVVGATSAIGTARKVEGGYRVSGRWPFASGAHHGSHFMGTESLHDPDGKESPPVCCYFERRDVVLHDTWRVSGLRGTGSCDFEVQDLFVPEQHTHGFMSHEPTQAGVVYRMPVISLMRDREVVQSNFSRVTALHASARAFLISAMTELMAAVPDEGQRLVQARAMLRAADAHAAETAVRIIDMISAEAGAASIFETNELERFARDVDAAVKHIAMTPNSYILAGRLGLGLDPLSARF